MASKIDPKTKRKLTWNIIREQVALKAMLPCRRGVNLHKSASFKMIPEAVQTNHKNDIKIGPKTIGISLKNQFQK